MESSTARAWSLLPIGRELRMYFCSQGKVYDATAAGDCSGLLQEFARAGVPTNAHVNPLHRKSVQREGGGGKASRAERRRAKKGGRK